MPKDAKGHGSNKRGTQYENLSDHELERRYKKLAAIENPTDAHADAMELVVDERMRRKGRPAPPRGRAMLPAAPKTPPAAAKRGATPTGKASPSVNRRGDTFKPKGKK